MPTFEVTLTVCPAVLSTTITVEAGTEEAAGEKARQQAACGDVDWGEPQYFESAIEVYDVEMPDDQLARPATR